MKTLHSLVAGFWSTSLILARRIARGRPRIPTAEYWREYYTRKQRE